MANYQSAQTLSLVCGEDLSGDQYEALTINTSGRVIKATSTTAVIIGILAENPGTTVAGETRVAVNPINNAPVLKGKAGAAITAGQVLIRDATTGRLAGVAALANLPVDTQGCGIALEAAADGNIFEFLALSIGGPHTA